MLDTKETLYRPAVRKFCVGILNGLLTSLTNTASLLLFTMWLLLFYRLPLLLAALETLRSVCNAQEIGRERTSRTQADINYLRTSQQPGKDVFLDNLVSNLTVPELGQSSHIHISANETKRFRKSCKCILCLPTILLARNQTMLYMVKRPVCEQWIFLTSYFRSGAAASAWCTYWNHP